MTCIVEVQPELITVDDFREEGYGYTYGPIIVLHLPQRQAVGGSLGAGDWQVARTFRQASAELHKNQNQ